jgi:thioredoxin 1
MSEVILTDANFESEVLKSEVPVLVDFWAPWCGPCQMLGPIIEEISGEVKDVKVVKVDVDQEQELAMQYQISSIPCVYVFENGQQKDVIVGFNPASRYLQALGL